MLIADCIPTYYGMTHPAPDYFYLKDRRPELYEQLVSGTADFLDLSTSEFTLYTDFGEGGFTYPSYSGGEEHESE